MTVAAGYARIAVRARRFGKLRDSLTVCTDSLIADIRALIRTNGVTATHIARTCGVTPQYMSDVLRGRRPLTPQLAARIGKWASDG